MIKLDQQQTDYLDGQTDSLFYDELTSVLTNAIQEQQIEINRIKACAYSEKNYVDFQTCIG